VWSRRKKIKNDFVRISPKFESHGFKTFFTERGTFCIRFSVFEHKKVVVPIKKDRAYQRFDSFLKDGWDFKTIMIVENQIKVVLKKDFPESVNKNIIVGVDIGSVNLATITVYDSVKKKILRQLYFGRDVAVRQREYVTRRAKLQSVNNRKYLRQLKSKQKDFVKTRSEQVAWEVVRIAKQFDAIIAIENIRNLKSHNKGKKFNGLVCRIPYAKFFSALDNICIRESIKIIKVSLKHTSQECPVCHTIDKRNRKNSIFKCIKCGRTLNPDRNASLNIALRAVKIAFQPNLSDQISESGSFVNNSVCPNAVVGLCSVNHNHQPMESYCF
jgi:IS605 OrfB family transposase